jgi:VCBS repeat-containing protein
MNRNLLFTCLRVLLATGVLFSLAGPGLARAPLAPDGSPPVADDQQVSTSEDAMLTIHLTASDPDQDPLTWTIVDLPANGTLNGNPPNLTYTPNPDFYGNDSFTFKVNDYEYESNLATVTIEVVSVNDLPVAVADSYDVPADEVFTTTAATGVLANDSDPDNASLTAVLIATTSHGILALRTNGSFTYNPDDGYSGIDTFTYVASDGSALSPVATVTLAVNVTGNTPPVADPDTYEMETGTTLTVDAAGGVLANDSDADGDLLTAQLVGVPTPNGTLNFNPDGSFTYTPNIGYTGADRFVYQAFDGEATSTPVPATINVNAPGNTAPAAAADDYQVISGTILTVDAASGLLANDSDPQGDALIVQLVGDPPAQGMLTLYEDGSFIYTPDEGFTGQDQFVYQAFDGLLASTPVLVTIEVLAASLVYLPLVMK